MLNGVKVKVKRSRSKLNHGSFDYETNTILMSPDESQDHLRSTLFHEMMHASLAKLNLCPNKEEEIVTLLETSLWPLIRSGYFNTIQISEK